MKKLTYAILTAVMILTASIPTLAEPNSRHHGQTEYEHPYHSGGGHRHKQPKQQKRQKNHHRNHKRDSYPRHHYSGHGFDDLVYRASYGSPNVQVYSMGNNMYIVRYMRNGRYYMRQINPVRNTILTPQAITLNGRGWYLNSNPNYYYVTEGSSINLNIGGGNSRPSININIPIGR